MAEIDFGTLVTAVVNELNCTTSELFGDELTDPDLAVKRYTRNVIGAIREVFDEAEAPAPVAPAMPTCSHCGAPVEKGYRFCPRCRIPQTPEAAAASLERLFAKELGRDPYDPCFRASLARVREEAPDQWDTLVQKLTVPAKA